MTPPPARTTAERTKDTLHRLEHDVDAWVATSRPRRRRPHLVPLSFVWDGATLLIATPADSATGRNLAATGRIRLGLGPTRDVVVIEGTVRTVPPRTSRRRTRRSSPSKTGFDPRRLATRYLYFTVLPRRVQAWREENELEGRELMRDGEWLSAP
ncbi:pyridoxamine 5'-phosphate oxidase family protein [Streptomyces lasalocidi]